MKRDEIVRRVREQLFEMQDLNYRDFQAKLIPTIRKERIIGVRTPQLRKFAREFGRTEEAQEFMKALPHQYYEENNLHGFLIERMGDYEACLKAQTEFLPYIDNWATCDIGVPKGFKKDPDRLLPEIDKWIESGHTYTMRYGIGMLMRLFLDERFQPEFLKKVSEVRSEEYYVNMMTAWYFATALAKQYDTAIVYLEEERLPVWTHNKAIQKAVESFRITREQKIYLRTLKIK